MLSVSNPIRKCWLTRATPANTGLVMIPVHWQLSWWFVRVLELIQESVLQTLWVSCDLTVLKNTKATSHKKLCYCRETAWHTTSVEISPFFDWAIENKIYSLRGCHLKKSFAFEKIHKITGHLYFPIMFKHIIGNTCCKTTLPSAIPDIIPHVRQIKVFKWQKWVSRSQ